MKNVLTKIGLLVAFVFLLPFVNALPFTDVPTNYWAYAAINFVSDRGIMGGVTTNTFAPSTPATRASAAVVLVRAFSLPLNTTGGPHFSDVPATHWAYSYVETLYNKGLSSGCGNGKYCPDQSISRAAFVVLMVRSLGLPLTDSTTSSFPDVSTTHWAFKYIQTAQENGLVVGYTNGNFGPEDNALRDQLAVILDRAMGNVYRFKDVPLNFWAYVPIIYVADHGIMNGTSPDTFAPSQSLKRDTTAVVLVRALGLPLNTTGGPHFSDVPTTQWAYSYIETLYNNGLSSGCTTGKYCPNDYTTRTQLAVLFVRGLKLPLSTTTKPHFPDVPATHFAFAYIQTAQEHGLMVGYTNGYFGPEDVAKRDQAATVAWRALTHSTPASEQLGQLTPTSSTAGTTTHATPTPTAGTITHATPTPIAGTTAHATPTPASETGKPASQATGTFSITLHKGWNLISTPLYSIHDGTQGLAGVTVTSTTCSAATLWHQENGQYADSGKLGATAEIAPFEGYWANVAGNCELKLSGATQVSLAGLHLTKGWNQIGGPLEPTAFAELKGDCTVTSGPLRYNSATAAFEKASTLQPGEGYFLKTAADCSLAESSGQPPTPE